MSLHGDHRGAERHSSDRRFREPYDDAYDADRDYGSHAAANGRDRARGPEVWELDRRLNSYGRVLAGDTPAPCRLCTPAEGYVCHFHRDETNVAETVDITLARL